MEHSFSTYARSGGGGEGRAKVYAMRTRGRGVTQNKSPFCMNSLIFSCAKYFYYILVSLATAFIAFLNKAFAMINSCLSNALQSFPMWNYWLDI